LALPAGEKPKGFQVISRRRAVERTIAWLSRPRRRARDYEDLPETGAAMIRAAMARIMRRSLA
jgi:putative transposase